MGVLYYYICEDCKQYLDAGKVRPPPPQRPDILETDLKVFPSSFTWFLWNHTGHKINYTTDCDDDCYEKLAYLTEVEIGEKCPIVKENLK